MLSARKRPTLICILALLSSCGAGTAGIASAGGSSGPPPEPPPDFVILGRSPNPDEKNVSPVSSVTVSLSEPFLSTSVPVRLSEILSSGVAQPAAAAVVVEEDEGTLTLIPERALRLRGRYRVTVDPQIRVADDRVLGQAEPELAWSFSVRDGALSPPQQIDFGSRLLAAVEALQSDEPSFSVLYRLPDDDVSKGEDLIEFRLPERNAALIAADLDGVGFARVVRGDSRERVVLWVEGRESPYRIRSTRTTSFGPAADWCAPLTLTSLEGVGNCDQTPVPAFLSTQSDDLVVVFRESGRVGAAVATFPSAGLACEDTWQPIEDLRDTGTVEKIGPHLMPERRVVLAAERTDGEVVVAWIEGPSPTPGETGPWRLAHALLRRAASGEWSFSDARRLQLEQPVQPKQLLRTRNGTIVFLGTDSGNSDMQRGVPYARSFEPQTRSWSDPATPNNLVGAHPDATVAGCTAAAQAPQVTGAAGPGPSSITAIWEGAAISSPKVTVWALELHAPSAQAPRWVRQEPILDLATSDVPMERFISASVMSADDGAIAAAFSYRDVETDGHPRAAYLGLDGEWKQSSLGDAGILVRLSRAHVESGQFAITWTERNELDEVFVSIFE